MTPPAKATAADAARHCRELEDAVGITQGVQGAELRATCALIEQRTECVPSGDCEQTPKASA